MTTLLVILLILVFISGAPLYTVMYAALAVGAYFSMRGFEINVDGAINKMFRISSREEIRVLSTIPMFIGAGYILAESKTADRLVRFANAVLGWMPGGLAVVTILTCALFTVFTGASGVTIIALGGVLMPALVRQGYPQKFSMGLIAGTGAVGLLFPPALPLFIYGTVYGLTSLKDLEGKPWSTEKFLAAGILPGLLLVAMLCIVSMTVAVKRKLPRQKFSMRELGDSFVRALPELFIPFGVILGLASGFGLPEVASLTVLYVLILEIGIYRAISLKQIWGITTEAMAMIGAILAIIFASTAFTDFLVQAEVPKKLVAWTQNHVDSKIVFLLAINVLLLIVGTVMDIFSAIVVVLPLIAPIARSYGIDPYHVGVIFLLNLEVGYLHPPVGLNLFLTSVKFQRPITEVMWATIPFLITMLVALLIISYVPVLTTASVRMGQLIGMSPLEQEPVGNLKDMVHDAVEESRVKTTKITLVDAAGQPLLVNGKPVERTFGECRKQVNEAAAAAQAAAESTDGTATTTVGEGELKRMLENCQAPFKAADKCLEGAPDTQKPCTDRAIAKWVAESFNEEYPDKAVIVIPELTFVNDEGEPLEYEEDKIGKDGKPVTNSLGIVEKESKTFARKDGKPVTLALATCNELDSKFDVEKCLTVFIEASACKISFDEVDDCLADKCGGGKPDEPEDKPAAPPAGGGSGSAAAPAPAPAAGSGSAAPVPGTGSGSAAPPPEDPAQCRRNAVEECTKEPVRECVQKAMEDWIKTSLNRAVALEPALKGGAKKQAGGGEDSETSGCSATNGAMGVLFVGWIALVIRRHRRARAA